MSDEWKPCNRWKSVAPRPHSSMAIDDSKARSVVDDALALYFAELLAIQRCGESAALQQSAVMQRQATLWRSAWRCSAYAFSESMVLGSPTLTCLATLGPNRKARGPVNQTR